MQTISPSIDRIGAALKALRLTHAQEAQGVDKLALGAKCLHAVIVQLAEEGVPAEDLQPLVELETILQTLRSQSQSAGANRRRGRPPSDMLLARACALIDLLIKAGQDENQAAQTVMRLLMASGVPAPLKGGDARGWRRLLECRADFVHGIGSPEAIAEYQDFTREIEAIPPQERVKRVLDTQLWDRRRRPR
jgi:hypothetical protein